LSKLRATIALPTTQIIFQAALSWWERHSEPTTFVYEQIAVPAARLIELAFNAPAATLALSIYFAVDGPHWISGNGFELLFIACIFGFWFAVGRWLDGRYSGLGQGSAFVSKQLAIGRLALCLLMIALAVFFLLFALHLNWVSLGEKISRVLLLLWSILLVTIPGVAFILWLRKGPSRRGG
jgi:hypothetical protein